MLTDLLLITLQLCGIVLLVGFTAAIIGSLIEYYFGDKKK